MQIRPRLFERSKEVSSLWPYHWEMLGASVESDCWDSLCLIFNSKSEDCTKRVRLKAGLPVSDSNRCFGRSPQLIALNLQDGPPIMALGNGPMQD